MARRKKSRQLDTEEPVYMEVGEPQIGEVTWGGSPLLSRKRDQILKMRDYMDKRVTPPAWGPPPPCKQSLTCLEASL